MATVCNLTGAAKVSAPLALSGGLSEKRVDSSLSACGVSLRTHPRGKRLNGLRHVCKRVRCDASHAAEERAQEIDTREFRKALTRGEKYNKTGYGYKKEMLDKMSVEYTSKLSSSLNAIRVYNSWNNATNLFFF